MKVVQKTVIIIIIRLFLKATSSSRIICNEGSNIGLKNFFLHGRIIIMFDDSFATVCFLNGFYMQRAT